MNFPSLALSMRNMVSTVGRMMLCDKGKEPAHKTLSGSTSLPVRNLLIIQYEYHTRDHSL